MECESKVLSCESITEKMKEIVERLQNNVVALELEKTDNALYQIFRENIEVRMMHIEGTFDSLNDKN